jgi:hypothetical protein
MARVEKARLEMSDDICRFFVAGMEPGPAQAQIDKFYRPIFDCRWNREEDYFGHVLVDRGEIAGFVGAFFVQRPLGGIQRRFCNLTTWKVREQNRSESILLILPFLRMKEYTVTGRTAARGIFAIHQKLGFKALDDLAIIVPTLAGRRADAGIQVCSGGDPLSWQLPEEELRLVQDHAPYRCHPVLLRKGDLSLLVMVTLATKYRVTVACVQYLSDVGLFLELLPQVKEEVSRRLGAPFLWIEKRLLAGARIPFSYQYRSPYVHLYKSCELEPSAIDNLYTEMVVFNSLENRFY